VSPLRLCLVSPFALDGAHPVAEHVRGAATALAQSGHRVTVLAPSSSTRALRSGRRRLRALAGGDTEALHALEGEPLQVAMTPAVPLRERGRRRGAGLPVAASANVALAVSAGGFDLVHVHEPLLPGLATAAVRHAPGLLAATFHSTDPRALTYPVRDRTRERYRARIDALVATSPEAAAAAAQIYPGDYTIVPPGISEQFRPGAKSGTQIAAEWSTEGRAALRALVKLVAATPPVELVLVWSRHSRRPMRPYVPSAARGRVHVRSPKDTAERAAALRDVDVFVAAPGGDEALAWEARAGGCAVVSPLPQGALAPDDPGLGYAADQPALAAAAAARLLEDARLREEVSHRSRAAAQERSFAAVAGRLEEIYAGLGKRRRVHQRSPLEGRETILADLHMHTNHSNDCATDPAALLDHCIEQGLGAIAITDHNEVSGALEAAALGKPITVIVGEEVKTSQGEVIGLFLHERIDRGMTMDETIAAIQDQGGLVYMPHPFDRLHTIPDPATLLRVLDGIDIFEVYNARLLFDAFNDEALRFAAKYNLIQAAGSDAHVLQGIGTALNQIPAFDGPEQFLLAMRQNQIVRRPKSLLYLQGLKWVQSVSR
jgi:predicted metal-dependent phosphoesterase TrpH/glycosyltransferase involved in cell wall biosynthesis